MSRRVPAELACLAVAALCWIGVEALGQRLDPDVHAARVIAWRQDRAVPPADPARLAILRVGLLVLGACAAGLGLALVLAGEITRGRAGRGPGGSS
jgi:hypothetical protein